MTSQQLIGLIGESFIYAALADSVQAFIQFDTLGFVTLVAAFMLVGWIKRTKTTV